MSGALKIGDRLADGSVTVRDEDRLCYQVLSSSKGSTGLRTISKALLGEWVAAVREHPDSSSQELRELLTGKTETDKFEYGYSATLKKMADMVLGNVEVIHAKTDYSEDFCKWFAENRGKGNDVTARKYLSYFKTLTSEYQEPTHSYWHGLYRTMYSRNAGKEVVEVGELAEFDRLYGGIVAALETKVKGEGMTDEGFRRAVDWFWQPEVKPHTCVTSALKAYADFLKWREEHKTGENEAVPGKDRLTVALKMYAAARGSTGLTGWESYDAWTHGVRTEFAEVNEGLLEVEGFDYGEFIRKYGVSWQVANSKFSGHSVAEKRAVLGFLREQREVPKAVSWYLEEGNRLAVGGRPVAGMGAMTVLYFLSELRPEEFAAWTEPTYEMLGFLGLHKGGVPRTLSVEAYEDCKGKQGRIVGRMRELGIGKASDDGSAADYRTVNEFLWWLKENKEAVQEETMRKQMSDGKAERYEGPRKALALEPGNKEDELLLRLLAALRAKPFVILAGHSGTGKSRYAKKLAYMTCNAAELRAEGQLPGNCLLLQVRPNWHDSTDLLGYRNAMDGNRHQKTALVEFLFKAMHYRETPFFLCLDEMNLAPVEQYFAEFLSAMESKEPVPLNDISAEEENLVDLGCKWVDAREELARRGFAIPGNLFIVGTVNMDETTNQFSRKVLDRAFTIEMTDVDFRNFGKVEEPGYGDTVEEEWIQALLGGRGEVVRELDGEDTAEGAALVRVQKALEETAFAIAYRFASEYTLFKRAIRAFDRENRMGLDALDQAVLMKILPRVAGEREYIERVYGKSENEGLRKALEGKAVSLAKIGSILKRAEETDAQYVTFWP